MNKEVKFAVLTTVAISAMYIGTAMHNDKKMIENANQVNELNEIINQKQIELNSIKNDYKEIFDEKIELEKQFSEISEELECARKKIDEYNRIVSFNEYNVTEPSNATIYHIRRALKGTELYDEAEAFLDAEKIYGINAFFMAAIAAQESAWGTSSRAMYQNNLTGHAVYNSNAKGTYFNSKYESIINTAHLLKSEYLSFDGLYFNGFSSLDVNKRYCLLEDGETIDYNWSWSINKIAYDLVEKANNFKDI